MAKKIVAEKICGYCGQPMYNVYFKRKYHDSCKEIVRKQQKREHQKEYLKRPEVKARQRERQREYQQRPEVKAKEIRRRREQKEKKKYRFHRLYHSRS